MTGTNNPELVILRGLQASGKSTWARSWVAKDRANRVRVNKDDLRSMIDDGVYLKSVTEPRIIAARDALVRTLLQRGLSVVVDDTNLMAKHVKDLARMAHQGAYRWRVQDFTDVPLLDCIQRNVGRKDMVDKEVILSTYERYLKGRKLPLPVPTEEELNGQPGQGTAQLYIPAPFAIPAFIIDIDGTVALRGTRDPFDESLVHRDQPNTPVIEQVIQNIRSGLYPIFCSGRTEACKKATGLWIYDNIIGPYGVKDDWELLMRKIGDSRKDSIVKLELFDQCIRDYYDIKHVFDDRNQVVQMWRSIGLTVFQVADGAF